jgi:hypothetical protein
MPGWNFGEAQIQYSPTGGIATSCWTGFIFVAQFNVLCIVCTCNAGNTVSLFVFPSSHFPQFAFEAEHASPMACSPVAPHSPPIAPYGAGVLRC